MATIGLRLANAVLFVLSCSVAADVISDVGAAMLAPETLAAAPPARVEAPSRRRWDERQAILDRNLFGAQVVSTEVAVAPEPVEDLQETKLPLKLLGTIASEDQRVASAAIENNSNRQHEVVKVGDALTSHTSVTVDRIDRGRVVLRNGARLEELTLDEDVAARISRQPPKRQPTRTSRRQARRARSTSVQDRLEQLADDGGPRSPAAIFSQARILPKYEDGAMVGIELSKIKDDSFYQKVGLEDGDVIMSVNGIPIDNPSASTELLGALTNAEELVAQVRKQDGTVVELNAPASELSAIGGLE